MYLRLHEVYLVEDKTKVQATDPNIYRIAYGGDVALTTDATYPGAEVYGVIYVDTAERICIIPNVWDEQDADRAKSVIRQSLSLSVSHR